jgi:hypothetical protein
MSLRMIQSFADRATEALFQGRGCAAAWKSFEAVAYRKSM